MLTRYADIEEVFRDNETYSAAAAQAPLAPLAPEAQQILLTGGHQPQPSMSSLDEPAHARLRKPAARAFSMKRVTAMIPAMRAAAAGLLDAVVGQPEFDLVPALAFPLPANIVFSLMGVPEAGLRPAEGVVRIPGRAELGAARARGPDRDGGQHGRLPRVHAPPGRRQGRRAR